jgi:cytochrome P450
VYEEVKSKPELNDGDLRLHPPAHFVLPHGVQSDAEIDGYTVPKGAEVNFLLGGFGRDETAWAALEFRPERFMDGVSRRGVRRGHHGVQGDQESKMMPFGAGRPMYPG